MRTIFFILGLLVLAAAVAMSVGLVNIDQTRPGVVQAPAFHATTGKVVVGQKQQEVTVPTLHVESAQNAGAPVGQ